MCLIFYKLYAKQPFRRAAAGEYYLPGQGRCITFHSIKIVFCEIIDRKIYLNLISDEVIDYYAYMDNGREIPVSRLRGKEFSSVVLQYMKNM